MDRSFKEVRNVVVTHVVVDVQYGDECIPMTPVCFELDAYPDLSWVGHAALVGHDMWVDRAIPAGIVDVLAIMLARQVWGATWVPETGEFVFED